MKIVNLFLFGFLLVGCAGSKVLPRYDQMQYNLYGAQIKIRDGKGNRLKGELIAANDSGVWVLRNFNNEDALTISPFPDVENPIQTIDSGNFYFFPLNAFESYSMKYARSRKYASMMGATVITFAHGWISAISFPVSLIVTGAVSIAGSQAYKYNEQNVPKKELNHFARYPQGLPPQLDVHQLGNNAFQTSLIAPQRVMGNDKDDFAKTKKEKRGKLE